MNAGPRSCERLPTIEIAAQRAGVGGRVTASVNRCDAFLTPHCRNHAVAPDRVMASASPAHPKDIGALSSPVAHLHHVATGTAGFGAVCVGCPLGEQCTTGRAGADDQRRRPRGGVGRGPAAVKRVVSKIQRLFGLYSAQAGHGLRTLRPGLVAVGSARPPGTPAARSTVTPIPGPGRAAVGQLAVAAVGLAHSSNRDSATSATSARARCGPRPRGVLALSGPRLTYPGATSAG